MDTHADQSDQSWGAKVTTGTASDDLAPCPSWVPPEQQRIWNARGVILWQQPQELFQLPPGPALDLLTHLQTTDNWRAHGIIVGQPLVRFMLPQASPKRQQPEEPTPPAQAQYRLTDTMQLTVAQTHQLVQVLQAHQTDLRQMAEGDKNRERKVLSRVYGVLVRHAQEKKAMKVDLSMRTLPWTHSSETGTWICDLPPNRVTVQLTEDGWFWRGCLERPHRLKRMSRLFDEFTDVLAWGEAKLMEAAAKDAQPKPELPDRSTRLSLDTLTAAHRKRLKRYWIDPQALEPAHPTYRVVIYLHHASISREYRELSFGEQMVWNEQYPAPNDLVRQLGLAGQPLDIDQIGKFNRITSLATYADATTAHERATLLWDRSMIAAAFQAGRVTEASYGIEEVETMYRTWIGGYGAWNTGRSDRTAFLARRAFELTLVHALDVSGYRAAMPIFRPEDTEQHVLIHLHERRMESPHIPAAARAESVQWLKEHGQADAKRSTKRA